MPKSNVKEGGKLCPGFLTKKKKFLLSSLPLSFSFQSIYKLANLWPKDSHQVGPSRQASAEHENDMISNSSDLGEASAGPMGPLAWGNFHVFQETLPYSGQLSLGERSPPHQNVVVLCLSAALPAASCGLASQASNALYTEFGCTLPSL